MLYQLLLGAWPPGLEHDDAEAMRWFTERLAQWQQKALREAKLRSHWLWPDEAYETACREFLEGLLAWPELCAELAAAARELDLPGALNGLVQATLRLTVPGVPDLYQGTEFWDYSLVDPDNRRPVDHAARRAALEAGHAPHELLPGWRDGQVKQAVIQRLLALRQARRELFVHGDYAEIAVDGEHRERLVAFQRQHGDQRLMVVVPRLAAALLAGADTPRCPPNAGATPAWCCRKGERDLAKRADGYHAEVGAGHRHGDRPAEELPVGVYVRDS